MKYVQARTHGAEYAWHKYWSRKPANVLSAYLQELVPPGGYVVDPFSGSGVVLREGTKLGFKVSAFDVNPVAVAISEFMISDLDKRTFSARGHELLERVESELGHLYMLDEREIRFLVHRVVTKCQECGLTVSFEKETHSSRGKKCLNCGARLSFGLKAMSGTEITEIVFADGTESSDHGELVIQSVISQFERPSTYAFDLDFVDNQRTLTSSKYSTKDFFTPRNFAILSRVAELAHSEPDPALRNALLLLVTGTSAQASRLIASRGKLAGGGQAWTVPGFWIPPVHLESNPFYHLRARLKKMISAIQVLNLNRSSKGVGVIARTTAQDGLNDIIDSGKKVDLVFMDPPYGDSVAFLEFSAIWNSFLASKVDYAQDISVSNRVQDPMTFGSYEQILNEICSLASKVLNPAGCVLLTFNNHDLEAWRAIVQAFQGAKLRVENVIYQDPAVVSSKSQMSREGSYVGDFYVIFRKSTSPLGKFETEREYLVKLLKSAAGSRGGEISRGLAYRFGLQEWLTRNLDASEIHNLDLLFDELFVSSGTRMRLKVQEDGIPRIEKLVSDLAAKYNLKDSGHLDEFAAKIAVDLRLYGSPSIGEALAMANTCESGQLW